MREKQWMTYGTAVGVVAAITLMAVALHHQATPVVQSPQSMTSVQPIRPPAPAASAPLLTREAWLMHWQPHWLQNEWRQDGRPPILYSTSAGAYYTALRSAGNITLTFPWQWELAPISSFPSWFNHPLRP